MRIAGFSQWEVGVSAANKMVIFYKEAGLLYRKYKDFGNNIQHSVSSDPTIERFARYKNPILEFTYEN